MQVRTDKNNQIIRKIINGKTKIIYCKPNDKKMYVKHNKSYITIQEYRNTMKKRWVANGGAAIEKRKRDSPINITLKSQNVIDENPFRNTTGSHYVDTNKHHLYDYIKDNMPIFDKSDDDIHNTIEQDIGNLHDLLPQNLPNNLERKTNKQKMHKYMLEHIYLVKNIALQATERRHSDVPIDVSLNHEQGFGSHYKKVYDNLMTDHIEYLSRKMPNVELKELIKAAMVEMKVLLKNEENIRNSLIFKRSVRQRKQILNTESTDVAESKSKEGVEQGGSGIKQINKSTIK